MRRIRGIVMPADWNEHGNVAALVIAGPNEEEYCVAMDEKGKALMSFLREKVEVSGIIREEEDKKVLKVGHCHSKKN